MPTRSMTFEGADGLALSATIEAPPSGGASAWALFAHCFTCTKNARAAVDLTRALSRLGIGVVRFDFTGLGESEGDFADTNFSSNIDDVVAAARHMSDELEAPSLLVGHSLGGAAVLHAAGKLPDVRAVATIGSPADPAHVLRHIAVSADEIRRAGRAEVQIGGRPFMVKKQFLDDLETHRMERVVGELDRALLILHAPLDEVVGIENAGRLYSMAKHPKSFVSLDGADHLLRKRSDSRYVADVLAAWVSRYVRAENESDDLDALRATDRAVTRTRAGAFYTDVVVRGHTLVADEPASLGGEDAGPTPYDYLLAGLGSCTSMTLQMYAARKGWPLDEAVVRLRHQKLHGPDCEECETGEPRLDVVDRDIALVGDLDEEQRARLMEIADRCPVHRTLDAGVRIRSTQAKQELPKRR